MPEKHIHKFRRHTYETGGVIYFCALPDCAVKIKPALTLGKRSICWRCGNEFIMTLYSIKLANPHCENCHKPKGLNSKGAVVFDDESISLPAAVHTKDTIDSMLNRMRGIPEEDGEI